MNFKTWIFLLLLLCISWVPGIICQTAGTGALIGTIRDSSGAVVPNAKLTVTSADTGQVRTATTTADGTYNIALLPPGNYRVKIEAGGFRPVEIPSVTVTVTETAVLDRALEVGTQTQSITVESEVEAIQTASSALGSVVNTQTVVTLPLSTRNFTNLLAMASGANADLTNSATIGKSSTDIDVNGADLSQNTYLQDGAPVDTWLSLNSTHEGSIYGAFGIPDPDTIQEFKIQTSTYDASYGRNPGANVNVITKSGTNDFHGTAFEFFRNTALNANDWFRNATGGSKLVLNQNQYGGVFGGPIKKDKLFFFVAYQETNQKNGISGFGYSTVVLPPIPGGNRGTCPVGWTVLSQCDTAAQAFVPALGAAVCPSNNSGNKLDKTKVGGVQVACDGSNINPVAVNILQLQLPNGGYLIPGSGSTTGQYLPATYTDPATYKDHQGMGNWDYVLNSKHTLSGRYYFEADPTNGSFASNGTSITASNVLPGSPVYADKTNQAAVLRLTSIVSNNFVNEARVSYQRTIAAANELTPFTDSQVGVTPVSPGINYLSYFGISGLFSFGAHNNFDVNSRSNQFEWADQVSWTHGKHTVRAGFEAERMQGDESTPGAEIGNPKFKTFPDFLIGRAACAPGTFGKGAGQCNTANPGNTNGTTQSNLNNPNAATNYDFLFRLTVLDAFVQDDIKVNSRLTLNLGVRWEWDGFPSERNGMITNIWPSLLNLAPVPGSGCVTPTGPIGLGAAGTGCSLVGFVLPSNFQGTIPTGIFQAPNPYVTRSSPPWDNFAPRIGFAWQPTASNRLVVRGGAGYFYELINGVDDAIHALSGTPAVGTFPIAPSATLAQPFVPPAVISGPPGTYGFTPRWLNLSTGNNSNLAQPAESENFTVPVTYEWNLNTQYEFLRNWVLELGYVGSHGIHQEQSGIASSVPYNWAPLASPADPAITGVTTNTVANVPLRVQYLGISPTASLQGNVSSYLYNALQATVRKQLSHGLQFQAAYTWNRAFVTTPYGINTAPYEIMQMAPNTIYHPQRLVVNYTWNLPFGHPAGIKGKLVDGWTLSGVTTIQDGSPITIYNSTGGSVFYGTSAPGDAPAQLCPGMTLANAVTSGPITSRLGGTFSQNGYLNPAAFCAVPVLGSDGAATGYGNIGQGNILAPGQFNWDISVAKSTKVGGLREDGTLLFRAEFFNAFNHPQFSFTTNNDAALSNQDASAGTFGQITTSSVNPRLIQLVMKYSF